MYKSIILLIFAYLLGSINAFTQVDSLNASHLQLEHIKKVYNPRIIQQDDLVEVYFKDGRSPIKGKFIAEDETTFRIDEQQVKSADIKAIRVIDSSKKAAGIGIVVLSAGCIGAGFAVLLTESDDTVGEIFNFVFGSGLILVGVITAAVGTSIIFIGTKKYKMSEWQLREIPT